MNLRGYHLQSTIYEGGASTVYRGRRVSDAKPVVVKALKEAYPSPDRLARFRLEYEIVSSLQLEGVVQGYGLEPVGNGLAIVMEDFGGTSLAETCAGARLDLDVFLGIASRTARILGELHALHILHRDVNPSNIVYNAGTGEVKLIDFGISTVRDRERPTLESPDALQGTLAYISPEQTGRMNRVVDYRTDLYSLGVTFYELLTGKIPFPGDDAMSIVHAHIARHPVPPSEVDPSVPPVLSEMVMKLMAKSAEERYQSAEGLAADLDALSQARGKGTTPAFRLDAQHASGSLRISEKLYGRSREVASLLETYERARRGEAELILVTGYSGIGKTALVNEVHKPIVTSRGYFAAGKFDQLEGLNRPYAALIDAFRDLIQQLLTEPSVTTWRERILDGLGPNGQVLVDVIPELAAIVGPQPPVPDLAPAETQNRFDLVFLGFVGALATAAHPLVIFLDDLQWADSPSLRLIRLLLTDPDARHLLLIGAYRDNEVGPAHPLTASLEELERSDARVGRLTLKPLDTGDVEKLVADTLGCDAERARPLSRLMHEKTGGNPFFLGQFITTLHVDGHLLFDTVQMAWSWETENIRQMNTTDNVVEFMADRIRKLPGAEDDVLRMAACIGNHFDLRTLATVTEMAPSRAFVALGEGIREGLILSTGGPFRFLHNHPVGPSGIESVLDESEDPLLVSYRFLHDRVQQAAYRLIPEDRRQAVHLSIGRLVRDSIGQQDLPEEAFRVVNHMNKGRDLITDPDERADVARLNLEAGLRAKSATAYGPAMSHFQTGIELLGPDAWSARYDLAIALHVEGAEAAYLHTDFDEMEHLASAVMARARSLLDVVRVYEIRIRACVARHQMVAAVATAKEILGQLGVPLPRTPRLAHIAAGLIRTRLILGRRQVEHLADLPAMREPHKLAAMRILMAVTTPAYYAEHKLFPLIACRMIELSVRYGNTPVSAYGYGIYGIILCSMFRITEGCRFGRLLETLAERFDSRELSAKLKNVVSQGFVPFREHTANSLPILLEGYQSGLETGDLEYAAFNAVTYCNNLFLCGRDLDVVERELAKYELIVRNFKQAIFARNNALFRQVVLNLTGPVADPGVLTGDSCDEERILEQSAEANDQTRICEVYIYKAFLCYVFNDYARAYGFALDAERDVEAVMGSNHHPVHHFVAALACLAVCGRQTPGRRRRTVRRARKYLKRLRRWAGNAPMNYGQMCALVEAEMAAVRGRIPEAMSNFDRAISLAREHGYVNVEAIACERASLFYASLGRARIADVLSRDARAAYDRWGATAKVEAMARESGTVGRESADTTPSPTTDERSHGVLDLTTVLKASQVLAGEIVRTTLLQRMMQIMIENAGATKGVFVLNHGERLTVEATITVDRPGAVVSPGIPLSSSGEVPDAVVQYVARTGEQVVLNDPASQGPFVRDDYVTEHRPRSLLCTPIVHQGQLTGILYMENGLTAGAFTPERLEVLALLSSQAAISIENARLYENLQRAHEQLEEYSRTLERKVEARTEELRDANRQLKERDELKTDFFANVSHELRTPLTAIKGYVDNILDGVGGSVNEQHARYLDRVKSNSDRLTRLISDLLDLSRIDRGRTDLLSLYIAEVSCADIVAEAVESLGPVAAEAGIDLTFGGEAASVRADRDRLVQIVTNLVGNAIKFTERGGRIHVSVRKARGEVELAVEDTGRGIPETDLERIFERFQQVKGTEGGTGLGLPITKELVELQEGTIGVESTVGTGSVFRVRFPAVDRQVGAPS